eukprot:6908812-Prymnesium_polylepis.1
MEGGEGNRMTEKALDFLPIKEAAKRVKQSGAQRKGKTLDDDDGDDGEGERPNPFEIGSICWMGTGTNRRHVTIQAIEKMTPLKYKVQLGETM